MTSTKHRPDRKCYLPESSYIIKFSIRTRFLVQKLLYIRRKKKRFTAILVLRIHEYDLQCTYIIRVGPGAAMEIKSIFFRPFFFPRYGHHRFYRVIKKQRVQHKT